MASGEPVVARYFMPDEGEQHRGSCFGDGAELCFRKNYLLSTQPRFHTITPGGALHGAGKLAPAKLLKASSCAIRGAVRRWPGAAQRPNVTAE